MQEFRPDPRARTRDLGLARLRRSTRYSIFGATVLAGGFAGLAAHANPGHKAPAAAAAAPRSRPAKTSARPSAPVAPVQATETETPTPAPPPPPAPAAPAPVTTSAPPVVTTGAT